ncbi:hypothetical protein K402DRAFT_415623 [Aulographum hederae CBS 113979]|uniref:FAM192A/Fyv6 N-terminal domain-containing protein n=1 Tax=Aulographum hederae CBS 113979 TaxID=1176131 RepID=A0A6G1GJV8_9PEZI|nr:hypothetical protein K402DRAFT_415623 [Aulographum hederae CBS 113979]
MPSGFVSGGTIDEPVERDDEWKKAQQEIEEKHKQRAAAAVQNGGKSLYEVLQANKAAKQEAFEESIKLKNQFRALDDDEVDFLDSVLESTRKQEAAVQKETSEQLEIFRKHQEEAERVARGLEDGDDVPAEELQWARGGRKRKKTRDKESFLGVKLRKTSSSSEKPAIVSPQPTDLKTSSEKEKSDSPAKQSPGKKDVQVQQKSGSTIKKDEAAATKSQNSPPAAASALGLGNYSSDEDN